MSPAFLALTLITCSSCFSLITNRPPEVWARYGLILVGSSPGGTSSNFWTMLFGGDINLSITMTFCSTIASFALTTFWLWFFARYVLSFTSSTELPYIELFLSLGFLVVPVVLGMLLNHK